MKDRNHIPLLVWQQFITTRTGDTVAEQNGVMGGQIQQDVEAEMKPVAEQQVVTEENKEVLEMFIIFLSLVMGSLKVILCATCLLDAKQL